jgi:hypothetical protein
MSTDGISTIFRCASRNWSLGIHDPTLIGWITFIAYLVTAGLCWAVVVRRGRVFSSAGRARNVLFWLIAALAVTGLGLNSQLDLQTWFTAIGRCVAHQGGWYETRQEARLLFVIGGALLTLVALAAMMVWLRPAIRGSAFAAIGLVLLATFVVIRTASIYHVAVSPFGTGPARVLELAGILLLAVAAVRLLRARRSP